MKRPGLVLMTVIDDRTRPMQEQCPFSGRALVGGFFVCNVNQTSDPQCVGADSEDCLLHQYDKFVVERLPGT